MTSEIEAEQDGWVKRDPMANKQSIEFKFRSKRFAHVQAILEDIFKEKREVRVLDLGGTEDYWRIAEDYLASHNGQMKVTLLNNEPGRVANTSMFEWVDGDASSPDLYAGERFDLVHSNSVIEHVGDWDRMEAFSANVKRLAQRYFVQTPNFWFPLEPHFRFVGFQWLPLNARVALMQRRNLGFFPKAKTYEEAYENCAEIRLLTQRQMAKLFDDADIRQERVAGLVKSIMAVRG